MDECLEQELRRQERLHSEIVRGVLKSCWFVQRTIQVNGYSPKDTSNPTRRPKSLQFASCSDFINVSWGIAIDFNCIFTNHNFQDTLTISECDAPGIRPSAHDAFLSCSSRTVRIDRLSSWFSIIIPQESERGQNKDTSALPVFSLRPAATEESEKPELSLLHNRGCGSSSFLFIITSSTGSLCKRAKAKTRANGNAQADRTQPSTVSSRQSDLVFVGGDENQNDTCALLKDHERWPQNRSTFTPRPLDH